MGKIVKFCTVCEESFAEKFSFCPNCAASLMAYEMKPVAAEQKVAETLEVKEPIQDVEPIAPSIVTNELLMEVEDVQPEAPKFLIQDEPEILELDSEPESVVDDEPQPTVFTSVPATESVVENEPASTIFTSFVPAAKVVENEPAPTLFSSVVPAETVGSFDEPYHDTSYLNTNQYSVEPTVPKTDYRQNNAALIVSNHDDGEFHTTLIEDKNNSTRQMLLLGAFLTVMFLTFGGVIVSLFTNSLYVGAINEDSVIAYLPGDAPDLIEEEEIPKPKTETKAGGGGGVGNLV